LLVVFGIISISIALSVTAARREQKINLG
jgi:hypothetical protein